VPSIALSACAAGVAARLAVQDHETREGDRRDWLLSGKPLL
jgi:hypothetical protein